MSKQDHLLKNQIRIIILGATIFLAGCGEREEVTNTSAEKVVEVNENETQQKESKILVVQEGTLAQYPDSSVGKAFESYFYSPKWDDTSTNENEDLVEFSGSFLYEEEEIETTIQFLVDENNGFDIHAVSYNDIPQNKADTTTLFTSVFEDVSIEEIESKQEEEQEVVEETIEPEQSKLPETSELETPFPLDTHLNDLRDHYGQSTYDDYFMGGRVVVFNEMDGYVLDDAETVVGFLIANPSINVFGTYIGMTPAEISSSLAQPAETFFDESETQSYVTYYDIENYKVSYFSDTKEGPTTSILIMES